MLVSKGWQKRIRILFCLINTVCTELSLWSPTLTVKSATLIHFQYVQSTKPQTCPQSWSLVTDVRPVVSKWTGRGASPKHMSSSWSQPQGLGWHVALTQLQRTGLAAGVVPELCRIRGGTQEAGSANATTTCRMKASEICRGSTAAVLAGDFFDGENCWGGLQSRLLGIVVAPTAWLLLGAPAFFFPVPSRLYHLSIASLWVWWHRSRSFVRCFKRLVAHPTLPLLVTGTLSSWGVSSWYWVMVAWRMDWCRQNEAALLPFLCGFTLKFFVQLCCWSFWIAHQRSLELLLFVDSCLIVDLCGRMKAGISYYTILIISLPNVCCFKLLNLW